MNTPAGCQREPSFEFICSVNGNIYTQIPFSSRRDAVKHYESNAAGLKSGDSIRMQLKAKGRVIRDTIRAS